jgi:hypothetical protein
MTIGDLFSMSKTFCTIKFIIHIKLQKLNMDKFQIIEDHKYSKSYSSIGRDKEIPIFRKILIRHSSSRIFILTNNKLIGEKLYVILHY